MPYTIGSPVFTYAQVMWHMPESQRCEKGCYHSSMCSNLSETSMAYSLYWCDGVLIYQLKYTYQLMTFPNKSK